jgi:hypothetical protein
MVARMSASLSAKVIAVLGFALLGVASLHGSRVEACAASGSTYDPECGEQCQLTQCNSSGPGSTWGYPCATCQNGNWIFCCSNDCYCGEN